MTENKVWNEMEVPMELDSVIMDAVAEGPDFRVANSKMG